jgi:hypothetical protein
VWTTARFRWSSETWPRKGASLSTPERRRRSSDAASTWSSTYSPAPTLACARYLPYISLFFF